MDRFDTWESYFYPETIDPLTGNGTLRNLLDERHPAELARREYVRTNVRAQQIEGGAVAIAKTYDGSHLRAIHRHLFQDVYAWAGEYRTVNMSKGVGRSHEASAWKDAGDTGPPNSAPPLSCRVS